MSDSKALLLPTTVLYWMATFWRSLDKNVFFFLFCVARRFLVHLKPDPLHWKVDSQLLDTGEVL